MHNIYELSYDIDWAPWKFDIVINGVNIEYILQQFYDECQKSRPKIKTSLDCGLVDLNDGLILEALGQSLKSHFETLLQEYKPRKALSEKVRKTLKTFNVVSE